MFRAAASALMFSLACSPDDVAHEFDGAEPDPEPPPEPEPRALTPRPSPISRRRRRPTKAPARPAPPACSTPTAARTPSASCGSASPAALTRPSATPTRSATRMVAVFPSEATRSRRASTPVRRCSPTVGPSSRSARPRRAPSSATRAPEALTYRLAAENAALTLDTASPTLAPAKRSSWSWTSTSPRPRPPIACCRSRSSPAAGPSCGRSRSTRCLEAGNFRGAVSFDIDGFSLGSSSLALDLDFRDDGTIVGRVDDEASLLWPQPLALTGTWNTAGDVSLVLRDRLPADRLAPQPARARARPRAVLTGKRTATGLEGTAIETITGLRAAPVRSRAPSHCITRARSRASSTRRLRPQGRDRADLARTSRPRRGGVRRPRHRLYGTDPKLLRALRSRATSAWAVPAPRRHGGLRRRAAGRRLQPRARARRVARQRRREASHRAWTWDDCAAEVPEYNDEGRACLDIAALHCAHALVRRGPAQKPGSRGATCFAASRPSSPRTRPSPPTSWRPRPRSTPRSRSRTRSASRSRMRSRASWRSSPPTASASPPRWPRLLTPAYVAGLAVDRGRRRRQPTANAHLAPLQLAADFARTTAQWARLAHRAGENPEDVRAAVHLAAIATHAAAAELHARLADNPAAAPGLHALGPALDLLAAVHDELGPDASPFGYPTAYVPLALGPEDIAKGRSNFDAVQALAADEVAQFDAGRRRRLAEGPRLRGEDPRPRRHRAADRDRVRRQAARPVRQPPRRDHAGPGVLRRAGRPDRRPARRRQAAGLRIRHAAQASANNLHAIAVEEERFGKEVIITLDLAAEIEAAHGQIFQIKEEAGRAARCSCRPRRWPSAAASDNMRARPTSSPRAARQYIAQIIRARRSSASRPRTSPASWRPSPSATPRAQPEDDHRQPVRERAQGQAGLQNALDELQRGEGRDHRRSTPRSTRRSGAAISRSSAPRRSPSSRTSGPRAPARDRGRGGRAARSAPP
jgi:hypothetical protein